MAYEETINDMYANESGYRLSINDQNHEYIPGLMYGTIDIKMDATAVGGGVTPEQALQEADARFQRLVDLLTSSPDFGISRMERVSLGRTAVTPTPPPAEQE